MMHSIYLKTLYEKRWFMLGWGLGFFALTVLMVTFYPAFAQDGALDELVANLPPAFEGLIGDLASLTTFSAYLASQLFDIRMPLIAGVMAIVLGLSLSTAEEETGELRTTLSLSVSRTRVFNEKWLALMTIMIVVSFGTIGGVYATLPFVENASIEFLILLKLVGMTLLMMIAFGTITYAAGMMFGKKSVANAIGILVIIGSFILTTFGKAVEWLQTPEKLSLLHYFPAVDVAKTGVENTDVAVLCAVIIVSLSLACAVFNRRDLG